MFAQQYTKDRIQTIFPGHTTVTELVTTPVSWHMESFSNPFPIASDLHAMGWATWQSKAGSSERIGERDI